MLHPNDSEIILRGLVPAMLAPLGPFAVKEYPGPYTTESATNAMIAFMPKTNIGIVQTPRHRRISRSQ